MDCLIHSLPACLPPCLTHPVDWTWVWFSGCIQMLSAEEGLSEEPDPAAERARNGCLLALASCSSTPPDLFSPLLCWEMVIIFEHTTTEWKALLLIRYIYNNCTASYPFKWPLAWFLHGLHLDFVLTRLDSGTDGSRCWAALTGHEPLLHVGVVSVEHFLRQLDVAVRAAVAWGAASVPAAAAVAGALTFPVGRGNSAWGHEVSTRETHQGATQSDIAILSAKQKRSNQYKHNIFYPNSISFSDFLM